MRLTIGFRNMVTDATHLTGIGRVEHNNGNARQFRLVADKLEQLVKRPVMQIATLFASGPYPFADAIEIFKSDAASGALRFFYNLLADGVVKPSCKAFLFASQSPAYTICGFGSFLLQAATLAKTTVPNAQNLRAAVLLTVGIGCDVHNSKVNTDILGDIHLVGCLNVAGGEKIKDAIDISKVGFSVSGLQQLPLTLTADKGNGLPTAHRPDANGLLVYPPTQDTVIVGEGGSQFEDTFPFAVENIGVLDFANTAHRHLRREVKFCAHIIVDKVMQWHASKNLVLPRLLADVVASMIGRFKREFQRLVLRLGWFKFDFGCEFHDIELCHERRQAAPPHRTPSWCLMKQWGFRR